MRISSSAYVKQGRRPAKEPFPFQELLPLRLKPSVSGKGDKTSNVACLYEMSVLFVCLKQNDFNQALCNNEIQTFQKCYNGFLENKFIKKDQEKKGIFSPGARNLSHKQINQILKRFPQS